MSKTFSISLSAPKNEERKGTTMSEEKIQEIKT